MAEREDADMWRLHARSFDAFLKELYAIMVDPCAEGEIKRDDAMQSIKDAALRDREAAALPSTPQKTISEGALYSREDQLADRLYEIRHAAWHFLEGGEERVSDSELAFDLPNEDYDKLAALLGDAHPEPAASVPSATAFVRAAIRFAKAHLESDRLDRHDDVEEVPDTIYAPADEEYNVAKHLLIEAYEAMVKKEQKA